MISPPIDLPQPPIHQAMPELAQDYFLLFAGVLAVCSVVYALLQCRQRKDLVPLYLLLGATVAIIYEPVGDILGMAYYPEINQITWIEGFGRKIPAFIALTYFFYLPPFILYFLKLSEQTIPRATWWRLWSFTVLSAFVFEPIPLHLGLWTYYGAQPLTVFGFPAYWSFLNATFLFGCAMGVSWIIRGFNGRRNWLIAVTFPLLLFTFHGAPSLPVALALSVSSDLSVTSIGAIVTMLLCVLIAYLGSELFCRGTSGQSALTRNATMSN